MLAYKFTYPYRSYLSVNVIFEEHSRRNELRESKLTYIWLQGKTEKHSGF